MADVIVSSVLNSDYAMSVQPQEIVSQKSGRNVSRDTDFWKFIPASA